MNILKRTLVLCGLLLGVSPVLAQTVTIGAPTPASASGGQVVSVPVNFTSGATALGGLTVDVVVSNSQFSTVAISCAGQGTGALIASCTLPDGAGGGKMRLNFSGNSVDALATGIMGTLSLTVANAAVPNPTQAIDGTISGAGNVDGSADITPLSLITMVDSSVAIAGPAYSSVPAAGGGTEFVFGPVVQNGVLASKSLVITNTGVGTLSGTCSESADPGNVFSITDGDYSAGAGLNDTVTVACNSAGAIATHTGTMSCTHNGGNVASPVVYDLSCQITDGPKPAYTSSNPTAGGAINLAVTEAGDPNPSQSMTITNTGAATTTLTGTCAMLGGSDPQITLTTAGGFSVAQGAAGSIKTVSCDASVQGNFSGTLSCSHNGTSPATPVNYAVSCVVPEAGSAVFRSSPVPGPIDVDNGADVVVGDTDPTKLLTFYNDADPGDQSLDISCALSGDAAISVDPDLSGGATIPPGGSSTSVNFTCDTTNSGNFTSTYTCSYGNGGVDMPAGMPLPQAIYNLSCGVRDPEAQVNITPAPSTPQTKAVSPGGSTSFQFDFTEINDEGEDGNLVSCSLGGGQGFTIGSPTFPTSILSGNTVPVVVNFTDPTGATSFSDTLTCVFSDSDDSDTSVSWPLTVNIGGDARFTVLKDFTDGNPGKVTVSIDCNTGLILDQDKVIKEDGIGVTFVVTDYTAGNMTCSVKETPVAGYDADYEASGDSDSSDVDGTGTSSGCFWTTIQGGVNNTCVITNSPNPVDVVINKVWEYPGSADASQVSTEFEVLLYCVDAGIVDGDKSCGMYAAGLDLPQSDYYDVSCKMLEGNGNTVFTEAVVPYTWPGGTCYGMEVDVDQAVEVENGCASGMAIKAGTGGSCTITNTVFYEGIPTLSEYGMALMALLMLGIGFVAVRRFA